MDILIIFGSEDMPSPEAADAEEWWAEDLAPRGIRGAALGA
jgi:hypothetical protein